MANSTSSITPQSSSEVSNLWWVAAIVLVAFGIKVALVSWIAGFILIAFAVVVSPYIFSRILSWLGANDPLQIRVVIVLFALASSTYVFFGHTARIEAEVAESNRIQAEKQAHEEETKRAAEAEAQLNSAKTYFAEHRAEVLAEFSMAVDSKNLATAKAIRGRFIQAVKDPEFDLVLNRYAALEDEVARADLEKARLAKISKLTGQLASVGATDYAQAVKIYGDLLTLDPANKSYQQKLERFAKARDVENARVEAAIAAATAKVERDKKINEQFSGYDGSHRKFERLIKQAMNDPDSYDHVETST